MTTRKPEHDQVSGLSMEDDFNPHVKMNFYGKKKFDFLPWLNCKKCNGISVLEDYQKRFIDRIKQ